MDRIFTKNSCKIKKFWVFKNLRVYSTQKASEIPFQVVVFPIDLGFT